MAENVSSYFELSIHCEEGEKQVFYRLYTEPEDWERKLWTSEAGKGGTLGEVKLMTARTKLLHALKAKNIVPTEEPASGKVEDHAIDAWIHGAEKVVTTDRTGVDSSGCMSGDRYSVRKIAHWQSGGRGRSKSVQREFALRKT
jgi:hypothetical protein